MSYETAGLLRIYIRVGVIAEWFHSKTPYLIKDTPKTPGITGCRVHAVMYCLGGCPLHWDLPSFLGQVEFVFL